MKASKRNIANMFAKREKLAQGKPRISKYAAKTRPQYGQHAPCMLCSNPAHCAEGCRHG